jgi:hypothetical protein
MKQCICQSCISVGLPLKDFKNTLLCAHSKAHFVFNCAWWEEAQTCILGCEQNRWPLAFAAKFIPLPEKPLSQFFGCCSCKRRKHGQSTRSTSNGLSTTTNSHSSQDLQKSETASMGNNRHHTHSSPNSMSVSSAVWEPT